MPAVLLVFYFSQPTYASVAWAVLCGAVGLAIRVWAAGYIRLYRVHEVQARELVTAGPYAYVRNPLYWGNFFVGLALPVAAAWWPAYIIFLILFAYTYGTIVPLEEEHLERQFGAAYRDYKRHVPRYVPTLRRYPQAHGRFDARVAWTGEAATIVIFLLAMGAFAIRAGVSG